MQLHIERVPCKAHYRYSMQEDSSIRITANYTFGMGLKNVQLYKDDKLIYSLRQTNPGLNMLHCIPILRAVIYAPFKFFVNGQLDGYTEKIIFQAARKIHIATDTYEIRLHNDNKLSIVKNDTQIALIQKATHTTMERNSYTIYFNTCETDNQQLLALFCGFIDVEFFPNHWRVSVDKHEKEFVFSDKWCERASWRPKE